MKKYFFIFVFVMISCNGKHELPRNTETSAELEIVERLDVGKRIRGEFVSAMWGVRIINEGEAQVLLGTEFHSVQIFSESGEHVGAAVLGALGGDQPYRLTPQGREQFIELSDNLRGLTGRFICKVFYLDDLRGEPKILEFNFDVR
jgi:hypothetical protein